MKKILTILALAAICAPGFAFERAKIRIKKLDNTVVEKYAPFEKQNGGYYRITIPVGDIGRDVEYIDVVADEAFARKSEAGFFVLGDGSYGEFTQDNGFYSPWLPTTPTFGMKTPRSSFIAIVKGLALEQYPVVEAKNGVYNVFPRFYIWSPTSKYNSKNISKTIVFDPYEDIVVDFYPLLPGKDDYGSMAKVYRDYRLGRGDVKLLRDRIKDNPTLAYTADSIYVRMKHALKKTDRKNPAHYMQTPETEPELQIFFTFDDWKDIMKRMKEAGIDKAEICSVGWNIGGHDGRFPQYFPVEERLGGEKKFREAIAFGKSLGYHITCHINQYSLYFVSNRWNDNGAAMFPDGELFYDYFQPGGMGYRPCFQRLYNLWVKEDFKKIADLGINGIFHIDVISRVPPYPCADPKHPINREQCAHYQNLVGEYAHKIFGGLASEGASDHLAGVLDFALYLWAYPDWEGKPEKLVTRYVPFWQLVYHGIIISNPYYSTIDAPYPKSYATQDQRRAYDYLDDPQTRWLKVVEFDGRPTFYYTDYTDLKPMKKAYDEFQKLKHLQLQLMTYHGELSKDVFVTRFENGEEIVVNYSKEPFAYKGETVEPRNYRHFKK